MSTAPMPQPPGGTLKCPLNMDPWIERDKRTGEINAECKLGPGPKDPNMYPKWVLGNLREEDRPRFLADTPVFYRTLREGKINGKLVSYSFAKFQISGNEGALEAEVEVEQGIFEAGGEFD